MVLGCQREREGGREGERERGREGEREREREDLRQFYDLDWVTSWRIYKHEPNFQEAFTKLGNKAHTTR